MKKIVRGRISRLLSTMLMIAMMVPSLIMPVTSLGHAATGGRQNIIIIPFSADAKDLPYNLASRILTELQINLSKQVGVQVNEIARNSPILSRAKRDQPDDATKDALYPAYDAVADPKTPEESRRQAAANLGHMLGVDAVVYGTIDRYEFVTDPDRQSLIHVTATKVMVKIEKDGTVKPLVSPIEVIGKSRVLPDGKGTQNDHDGVAIANIARDLAIKLTGGQVKTPANEASVDPGKTPKSNDKPIVIAGNPRPDGGKKGGSMLLPLLLVGLLAAAAGGGGGGGGSTPPPPPGSGIAFSEPTSVILRIPYDPAKPGTEYQIFRSLAGSPSTKNVVKASRASVDSVKIYLPGDAGFNPTGNYVDLVDGPGSTPPPTVGMLYTYSVKIKFGDGSVQTISITNGEGPVNVQPTSLIGPGFPAAVRTIQAVSAGGSVVNLSWTINDTALVQSYLIQSRLNTDVDWTDIITLDDPTLRNYQTAIITPGTYQFRVITIGPGGTIYPGEQAVAQVSVALTNLQAPTNLQLESLLVNDGTAVQMKLTWDEPADTLITGYQVYRQVSDVRGRNPAVNPVSRHTRGLLNGRDGRGRGRGATRPVTRASGPFDLVVAEISRGTNTFIDTDIIDSKWYTYQVRSIGDNDMTSLDSVASNTVQADVPPGNVINLASTGSDKSVTVTWDAPTDNADGSPISMMNEGGFRLYKLTTPPADEIAGYQLNELPASPLQTIQWSAAYTNDDTEVSNGTTYYYVVVPYDNLGQRANAPYPYTSATPAPIPTTFTMTPASAVLIAGGPSQTMTMTVQDGQGVGIPDIVITVACPDGDGVVTPTTVTTNASGIATAEYAPPSGIASDTTVDVTATIDGGQGYTTIQRTVTYTVKVPVPNKVNVTASPEQVMVGGTTDVTVKVVYYDINANEIPVPNADVNLDCQDKTFEYYDTNINDWVKFEDGLAQGVTGLDGTFVVKVRVNLITNPAVPLTGSCGAISGQKNLVIIASSPANITLTVPDVVVGSGSGSFNVTDANGNAVNNTLVNLSITKGSVSPSSVYTDANGNGTFTINATPTSTGAATVTATVSNILPLLKATADLDLQPQPNPELIIGETSIVSNAVMDFVWLLKSDTNWSPLVTTPVVVKVNQGSLNVGANPAANPLPVLTDAQGRATFKFTAPATIGTVTLQFFQSNGITQIGNNVTLVISLEVPTGLTATTVSSDTIQLDWNNVTSNEGYQLQRSTDLLTWTPIDLVKDAITYQDGGLTAATTYSYQIRSRDSLGNYSAWSAIASATTAPAPPANPVATVLNDKQVTLSWDTTPGISSYLVQYSTDDVAWLPAPATQVNGATSYTFNNLTANTLYYFHVASKNAIGTSLWSDSITALTAPGTPTNLNFLNVSATPARVILTWNDVDAESGYEIERSPNGATDWVPALIAAQNVTTITDYDVSTSSTYFYRVRSYRDIPAPTVYSNWSTVLTVNTGPEETAISSIEVLSPTSVKLNWSTVPDATGYRLQFSSNGGTTWTDVVTVPTPLPAITTSYNVNGLTAGTVYYFNLIAVNGAGGSTNSIVGPIVTQLTGLQATVDSPTQVTLKWNPVQGETGTIVQSSLDMITWTTITTIELPVGSKQYIDTDVTPATTVHYRVLAGYPLLEVNVGYPDTVPGWTLPSDPVTVTTTPPPPTGLTAQGTSDTQITVDWDAVPGITQYLLQSSTDGIAWTPDPGLEVNNTTQYKYNNMNPNTLYYFRVAAKNATGTSDYSAPVSALTGPARPTGLTVQAIGTTTMQVDWNDIMGESQYQIQRRTDQEAWPSDFDITAPTGNYTTPANVNFYVDASDLQVNTTYYYRVRAINTSGATSAWCDESFAVTGPATGLMLEPLTDVTNTDATLTWNSIDNITGFKIEQSTNGTTWANVVTTPTPLPTTTLTYTVTGLLPGTQYFFHVIALNAAGQTISNDQSTYTLPNMPEGLVATAIDDTEIDLAWTALAPAALAGVTGYKIYRSIDGITWPAAPIDTIPATMSAYQDMGLSPATEYYYQIVATNATGDSLPSLSSFATTFCAAPLGLSASSISADQIRLTWTDVEGENTYTVQRSDDGITGWVDVKADIPSNVTIFTDNNNGVGLNPSTIYYYRIKAVDAQNRSSDWSTVANAMTSTVFVVQSFTLDIQNASPTKIYYSADLDDQLADNSQTSTVLVLRGASPIAGASVTGARVQLTTDKGTFDTLNPDQVTSNNFKSITGTLDANGQMTVLFRGRRDNGTFVPTITLPIAAELGTPQFTATSILPASDPQTPPTLTVTTAPKLIGPPYQIKTTLETITNPDGWPVQSTLIQVPILAQDVTSTIDAAATDLLGQPVLTNMPIWFVQSYNDWVALPDPADYDYTGTWGAGNVRGAYGLTDASGMAKGSFASGHSGLYTLHAFALRKNFNKPSLDTVANLNTAVQGTYVPSLLTSDGASALITDSVQLVSGTYVVNTGWTVYDQRDPANIPVTGNVNCDGTNTFPITVTGVDADGKKVLPGTPMAVATDLGRIESLEDPTKHRTMPIPGALIGPTNFLSLSFNQRSEVSVLSRGILRVDRDANPRLRPTVGKVHLMFDNRRQVAQYYTTSPATLDLTHFGPDPNAANTDITIMAIGGASTISDVIIAGADQTNTAPNYTYIHPVSQTPGTTYSPYPTYGTMNTNQVARYYVTMFDGTGSVYPSGVKAELLIDGASEYETIYPVNNGFVDPATGQLAPSAWVLHYADEYDESGDEVADNRHTVAIKVTSIAPDGSPLVKVFTPDEPNLRVTRPNTVTWTEFPSGATAAYTVPLSAQPYQPAPTATIDDQEGTTVLNGFNMQYNLKYLIGTTGPSLTPATANTIFYGSNTLQFIPGTTPVKIYFQAAYAEKLGTPVTMTNADTGVIYVGQADGATPSGTTTLNIPKATTNPNATTTMTFTLTTGTKPVVKTYPISILKTAGVGTITSPSSQVGDNGAIGFTFAQGTEPGTCTVTIYDGAPLTNRTATTITINVYDAPQATVIVAGVAGAKTVALTWTNVLNETGYTVEYTTDPVALINPNLVDWAVATTTAVDVTTFTVPNLTTGTQYYFRVSANNLAGRTYSTVYGPVAAL
ncbi:MAG: fibronectin type III domain-containing protein [Armatimonadota bacterium]